MKTVTIITTTALLIISDILQTKGQKKEFKCSISNDRCSLPFTFAEKSYSACTTDGIGGDRPWCPTKVYPNGTADPHYCMECWGEQRCYYFGDSFPDSSWTVTCPTGCYHVQKRVYGTNNEFSERSFICAAAIHQGLITNNTGGVVTVRKLSWRRNFVGAERNGVKTYYSKRQDVLRMQVEVNNNSPPSIIVLQGNAISRLQPDRTMKSLRTGQQAIGGIACDVRKKKIYWSNPSSATIMRADYNGKSLQNLRSVISGNQVVRPELIAVDWINQKIYWTDSVSHTISVSDINGQAIDVLIRRDRNFQPKGLALDLKHGYLYVADGGNPPKISKCSTGSSANCETVINQDIVSPTGIAIDPDATMFCWTDARIPRISCADLDGSNRRNMKYSKERLKDPRGIAIFDGIVYWTDAALTIIASAKLADWNSFHIHYGDFSDSRGLLIFDVKAQRIFDPPSPPISKDAIDVYVADTNSIRRFRIDIKKNSVKVETVTSGLKSATSVAVDTKKNEIYWTDSIDKKIYRTILSRIPNSGRKVIVDESGGYIMKPEGIAIDSANRLLYWTDIDLHGVYVANLDLKNGERYIAAIYIGGADYKPRGLALSPDEGLVYIADSGKPYRVQKCETKYNGGCSDFIARNLQQPHWIALDDAKQRIYVSSAAGDKLRWTSFIGRDKGQLESKNIIQPYGIEIHKDRIYVSDTNSKSITSFDKQSGSAPFVIGDGMKNPLGIFLHDSHKKNRKNHCAGIKCRYICVPSGKERSSCLCPEQHRGTNAAEECTIIPPCQSKPCKNKGRCVENARRSDFTCECPTGYGGKDCSKEQVEVTKKVDPVTKAISLTCVAPREIRSQAVWYHNRNPVDRTENWVRIHSNNRVLTIERPHYTHSGKFACQVTTSGEFERRASIVVKIKPPNINFACGESPGLIRKTRQVQRKIIGGGITKNGNAPFVAMLALENQHSDLGPGVFCGGSLVTTKHVISAAHCFQKISFKEVVVLVGKYQANLDVEEKLQQKSAIHSLTTHPSYNPKSLHADYAILTVKDEFYFTSFVKPICIAHPTDTKPDITPRSRGKNVKYGVVYGWGLNENGPFAKQLREVVLPILKHNKCKSSYKPGLITDLMFCAGGGNSGDACQGDSGGPFTLWSSRRNRWYLGGLVTKGEKCRPNDAKRKPGIYARIGSSIRKWIYQNTDLKL